MEKDEKQRAEEGDEEEGDDEEGDDEEGEEEEGDEEEVEGSGDGQDDLIQQTTAYEEFHLHFSSTFPVSCKLPETGHCNIQVRQLFLCITFLFLYIW